MIQINHENFGHHSLGEWFHTSFRRMAEINVIPLIDEQAREVCGGIYGESMQPIFGSRRGSAAINCLMTIAIPLYRYEKNCVSICGWIDSLRLAPCPYSKNGLIIPKSVNGESGKPSDQNVVCVCSSFLDTAVLTGIGYQAIGIICTPFDCQEDFFTDLDLVIIPPVVNANQKYLRSLSSRVKSSRVATRMPSGPYQLMLKQGERAARCIIDAAIKNPDR